MKHKEYDPFAPTATSVHHMIPLSRGGKREKKNEKVITNAEHRAYNTLFGSNALPSEIIERLTSGNFQLTTDAQWRAWKILFDHMGPIEAAAVIAQEWTPLEL